MLPGHVDLLLQITSALRTRSARAQGDDQAIRGLLQLLGELFRDRKLADMEVGSLVTLDQVYEVQHTALDSDVQASMARILNQCADDPTDLTRKVAKAVALLELIQEIVPTDAKLVAQCLYDKVDRGSRVTEITEALEDLRRRNLLGYSEKQGYKIQSTAGEEWERERRDIGVPREEIGELLQESLNFLLATPDRPRLRGAVIPLGRASSPTAAGSRTQSSPTRETRRPSGSTSVSWSIDERTESAWVRKSAETALHDRLVWVCGDTDQVEQQARELQRSRAMVAKYRPRRESLVPARSCSRSRRRTAPRTLRGELRDAVAAAWLAGRFYFRGRLDHAQGSRRLVRKALRCRRQPGCCPSSTRTSSRRPSCRPSCLQLVEARALGPVAQVPHGRARHPRARLRALRRRVRRGGSASRSRARRIRRRRQRDGTAHALRRPAVRLHRRTW